MYILNRPVDGYKSHVIIAGIIHYKLNYILKKKIVG